jgi:hypothetical protein
MTTSLSELWVKPGIHRCSTWAIVGGACGLLAAIPVGPSLIRALLLLAFLFLGPGAVALYWVRDLPTMVVRALVPLVGLSIVLVVVSLSILSGYWSPRPTLLALAAVTFAAGLVLRAHDERADGDRLGRA